MNQLFLVICNLGNKKLWSKLRVDVPLLFFLPMFLLAQGIMLGCAPCADWKLVLLCLVALISIRLTSARLPLVCMGLVPGILTAQLEVRPAQGIQLSSLSSYLVVVNQAPRFRRPDEVELSLELLGELKTQSDPTHWRSFRLETKVLCRTIHLPWRNAYMPHDGTKYIIRADFSALKSSANPFDYESMLKRHGYMATCRLRYLSKPVSPNLHYSSMYETLLRKVKVQLQDNERSGLLLAMLLGERDSLSRNTEDAFKRTGLAHLLVFSGYQVTLIYAAILWLLRWCLCCFSTRNPQIPFLVWANLGAFVSTSALVYFIGIDQSGMRASASLLLMFLAHSLERSAGFFNSILFSLCVLSILWPGCIFEPSVQLTAAALFAIALGARRWREAPLSALIRVSWLCSLFTGFVCSLWFGSVSLFGVFLNPLLAPLSSFLSCIVGGLGMILFVVGVDSQAFVLHAVSFLLLKIRDFILWIAQSPYCALSLEEYPLLPWVLGFLMLFLIAKRCAAYITEFGLSRHSFDKN